MRRFCFGRPENLLRDFTGQGSRAEDFAAGFGEVGGAPPRTPDFGEGLFDETRGFVQPKTFAQQHRQRKNLSGGIRGVRAGQIVRTTVIGLINAMSVRIKITGNGDAPR